MKLYVCWGTFDTPMHEHVCATADKALTAAGHKHEVARAYSFGGLPGPMQTATRKRIKAAAGKYWVPALELDDGTWIQGSKEIVAWAEANPAT